MQKQKQQQQQRRQMVGLGPLAVTHVRQAYLLLFAKSLNCPSDAPGGLQRKLERGEEERGEVESSQANAIPAAIVRQLFPNFIQLPARQLSSASSAWLAQLAKYKDLWAPL